MFSPLLTNNNNIRLNSQSDGTSIMMENNGSSMSGRSNKRNQSKFSLNETTLASIEIHTNPSSTEDGNQNLNLRTDGNNDNINNNNNNNNDNIGENSNGIESRFINYNFQFIRSHSTEIIVILFAFFVLNSIIFYWGSQTFQNVRYSGWFKFDGKAFMKEQDDMIFEAEDYVRTQSPIRKEIVKQDTNFLKQVWRDEIEPDRRPFCIAIMSRARTKRYLIPEVASVLRGLSAQEHEMAYSFVFSTDLDPQDNLAAQAVKNVIPVVSYDDLSSHFLADLPRSDNETKWSIKQTMDFMAILKMCQKLARYCVMLEDDAVASPHFVNKLMRRAIPKLEKLQEEGKKWLLVRLFFTDFWNGWENSDLPLLLTISSLVAWLFSTIQVVLMKLLKCGTKRKGKQSIILKWNYKNPVHVLIFICWLLTALWVPLAIGKQNIQDPFPNTGLHIFSQRASNVAVMYPSSIVNELNQYFRENLYVKEVDLLVDDVALQRGWLRFQLLPHLFQHIGALSSNQQKSLEMIQGDFSDLKISRHFDDSPHLDSDKTYVARFRED